MTCTVSLLRLCEYLDGELRCFRHQLLARHLRRCGDCRQRLSELKAADALVHLAREHPPAGRASASRLPGRLQVELGIGPTAESGRTPARPRRAWVRPAAAAAIVLLLASAGTFAFLRPAREAGKLHSLGMENRVKAEALLDQARTIEVQILCLRMQLIEGDLDAEKEAVIEEQFTRLSELSELLVSIKAAARLYRQAHEPVAFAANREKGR